MVNYDWKQMSVCVTISSDDKHKVFGKVNRMGKCLYRNYHHPLKNGKGMSFLDVFIARQKEGEKRVRDEMIQIVGGKL